MGRKPLGKRIHSSGYVILSGGRHGKYEHRVVVEQELGRPLLPNEDVHHKNENKQDNFPANLEILSKANHTKLHHPKQLVKTTCGYCRRNLEVHPYKLKYSKSGLVFCNNVCSGKYNNRKGVKGTPFSDVEREAIIHLRQQNYNYNQIAKQLSRNRESIRTYILREEL